MSASLTESVSCDCGFVCANKLMLRYHQKVCGGAGAVPTVVTPVGTPQEIPEFDAHAEACLRAIEAITLKRAEQEELDREEAQLEMLKEFLCFAGELAVKSCSCSLNLAGGVLARLLVVLLGVAITVGVIGVGVGVASIGHNNSQATMVAAVTP